MLKRGEAREGEGNGMDDPTPAVKKLET